MLTVKRFNFCSEGSMSALVSSYGREYSIIREIGRDIGIYRTNARSGYDRTPAWKIKADKEACQDFIMSIIFNPTVMRD